MEVEHIPNKGQDNNEFPFAYLTSKDKETGEDLVLGTGWESIVKRLGPDWVLKEVNRFNSEGKERSQEMIDNLRGPERIQKTMKDQNKLEQIFGDEHFVKNYYIYGKDLKGEEGYIVVQKLVPGKSLSSLIGTEYSDTRDMVSKNREEIKEILWGLKKAFIEFGVPIDFHPGNLIKNEKTGNLVIIDTGIPSDEYRVITDSKVTERTVNTMENAYTRLTRMRRYEEYLHLNEEEKDSLDKKFNISDDSYRKRVEEIDRNRIEKNIKIDIDKDPVDKLLDSIFGEREEVNGQEIYDYAIRILGNNQPTEGQKIILEELKKQGTTLGNRSYWKSVVDL